MKFSFLIALASLVLLFSNCEQPQAPSTDSAPAQVSTQVSITTQQAQVAGLQLGKLSQQAMPRNLKVNGTLQVPANDLVSIIAPLGGYIKQIKLEPGMSVRQGQSLFELENPEFIQLQQDYLDLKAKVLFAQQEFDREQELSRENINAGRVFQQASSTLHSLEAQLAGLDQRLRLLKINPRQLSPATFVKSVFIPAPISGVITRITANKGRFVNPSDVILEIINPASVRIELSVYEKDILSLKVGQKITFGIGDNPNQAHQGWITSLNKSINPDRTITVLAKPKGPVEELIAGSYVTAQITLESQLHWALPETAIVHFSGKNYIYILEKKTPKQGYTFRQEEIKTGLRHQGFVAIELPTSFNLLEHTLALQGAYSLVSKLNNNEE